MFKWKKLGRIFNPVNYNNYSWIKEYAQAPSVLVLKDSIRVFFSSRVEPQKGQYISRLGYIDLNRKNLFQITEISMRPVLELGELGTFDEFGTYPASLIKVGKETRVYYAGWTRCDSVPFNAAIGLAISNNDGKSFNKVSKGPILPYSLEEPFILGSPKIRYFNGTWYLWYSSGKEWIQKKSKLEPYYKIRMATSRDGFKWIKYGEDLISDVLGKTECQAGADVFFHEGKYHMFFSYRDQFSKQYKVGYAYSNDLFNWTRDNSKAGLIKSESGWDSESISYPHVFILDKNIYMIYQGNEIGKYGFGIAVLENYFV